MPITLAGQYVVEFLPATNFVAPANRTVQISLGQNTFLDVLYGRTGGPSLLRQPTNQAVFAGQDASFAVEAAGAAPELLVAVQRLAGGGGQCVGRRYHLAEFERCHHGTKPAGTGWWSPTWPGPAPARSLCLMSSKPEFRIDANALGQLRVTLEAPTGWNYRVESTPGLGSGTWQRLTNHFMTASPGVITTNLPPIGLQLFLRAVVSTNAPVTRPRFVISVLQSGRILARREDFLAWRRSADILVGPNRAPEPKPTRMSALLGLWLPVLRWIAHFQSADALTSQRLADWKSAIRQVGNLRYATQVHGEIPFAWRRRVPPPAIQVVLFLALAAFWLPSNVQGQAGTAPRACVIMAIEGTVEVAKSGTTNWVPVQINQRPEATWCGRAAQPRHLNAVRRSVLRLDQLTTTIPEPAGEQGALQSLLRGAIYSLPSRERRNPAVPDACRQRQHSRH